jgi:hypothetical protein
MFMFKDEVSFKFFIFNSNVFALLFLCPNFSLPAAHIYFSLPAADIKTFLLPCLHSFFTLFKAQF